MKNAVPPRLAMPASNVRRVRSEGFSKNITSCLPSRVRRKSEGRALTTAARSSTERTSAGLKSRVETRSRMVGLLTPGTGPTEILSTAWLLILRLLYSFLKFDFFKRLVIPNEVRNLQHRSPDSSSLRSSERQSAEVRVREVALGTLVALS